MTFTGTDAAVFTAHRDGRITARAVGCGWQRIGHATVWTRARVRGNSATAKTIRIGATGFKGIMGATATIDYTTGVYKSTSTASHTRDIPTPKGAVITAIRVRSFARSGTSVDGFNEIRLYRKNQDGTATQVGSTGSTSSVDTWETLAIASLSESTDGDRAHYAVLSTTLPLGLGSTFEADASWLEYDIDVPNVDVNT